MTRRSRRGWLAAACFAVITPLAWTQDEEPDSLDESVAAQLEEALAATEGWEAVESDLYRACNLAHGHVDLLLEALGARADDEEAPDGLRSAAKRLASGLHHRRGDLERALELVQELTAGDDVDSVLLAREARLLDALGRVEPALAAYEKLLEATPDEDERDHVRLRIAMIRMAKDEEEGTALAEYAGADERDVALRNRAAVVLGLLQRPQDAIDLFVVEGDGTSRFRQEIRVAEWAIRADDAEKAQKYAWQAVASAKLRRDRHYALTVLVEAHRMDESLDALIETLATAPELPAEAQGVWIDLLRETERYGEALSLFQSSREGEFDVATRRELLEMYREAGQEDVMVDVYRGLIADEPDVLEWREGLSRFYLERGNRSEAETVWREPVGRADPAMVLTAAHATMELGLDERAVALAEEHLDRGEDPAPALLFLFGLYKDRGDLAGAEAALERLDEVAARDAASRLSLAEAFEQLGKLDRAARVLEAVRDARGSGEAGEDLEMRLSWLYSELDEEERAMESWLALWRKIDSVPRRRYVEDRLMTVAARLGKLADVAIELEDKLAAGTANDRESGLLVRLYVKVKDPVSASEVIEEFMKQSGGNVIDELQEKARVYVACEDYVSYEETVHELIAADPEGRGDYLRQLAMSMLERGRPDEARDVLIELKDVEDGQDSAEFEAGVLALAGMRPEAVQAYRKGLARNPSRIDSYLLMANLMKQGGRTQRAVGMFQYLAETAERDDLFTIAIDGLLNMEARPPVLKWARRITLERLTRRHDKMYLYQLLSDLSEELEDREAMLTSLESSLSISGERRPSVLRELMDLARAEGRSFGRSAWKGDSDKHLAYGRRLIGLEELVPPQVYLDLGQAFLEADEAASARKTFRMAHELPDQDVFQRRSADLFEQAGYVESALSTYEQVLVLNTSDVGLMAKVGELQEQLGRDEVARELYQRALELLLSRRPLTSEKAAQKTKRSDDPFVWFAARNVDDFDQYASRVVDGLLVTTPPGPAFDGLMRDQRAGIEADLASIRELLAADAAEPAEDDAEEDEEGLGELALYPRLLRRTEIYRRIAMAYGRVDLADAVDLDLLATFEHDEELLADVCRERLGWGLVASARGVVEASARPEEERREVLFLVGEGGESRGDRLVPLAEATRLFLPLLASGQGDDARELLRRTDFGDVKKEEVGVMQALFSAAMYVGDRELGLFLARHWVRLHVKHGTYEYELEPVIQRSLLFLDDEGRRSLCEYFVSLVLEDEEKAPRYITMLPALAREFEEPLVTQEQLMDLIDGYGEGRPWGMGPVLQLLPEASRAAALRSIWPKVPNTGRATFLIQLASDFKEPMGDELAEFITGAFPETLEHLEDIAKYYVGNLFETEHNADVVLAIAEGLAGHNPADAIAGGLQAVFLARSGRQEEALAAATDRLLSLLDADRDYYIRRARDKMFEEFLPEHLPHFLAELDRLEAEQGPSVDLSKKRLDLVDKEEDPKKSLAALLAAVEAFPEEIELLQRLRTHYSRNGRPFEALQTLERMVELEPEEPKHRKQLMDAWLARKDPVRALEVREGGPIDVEEEDTNRFPPGAMIVGPGGVLMQANNQPTSSKKDWPEGKIRPANIERVKETLDDEDGDEDEARTTLRRIWRQYPKDGARSNVIYYFGGGNTIADMKWPADEEEDESEEEDDEAPRRGGLDNFRDEEPEEEDEQRGAWQVLAEHAFGAAEIERYLRSSKASQLDTMQPVFEGLLHARTFEAGEDATLEELIDVVREGRAGKIDYVLFLALLDQHPNKLTADVRELLRDLLKTLNPQDAPQLRRLARTYARAGATEQATRLYRWCATQTISTSPFFGGETKIDPRELVKEVKEELDEANRIEVIDAILEFSNPGDAPWQREQYELLVLEAWEEIEGAAATLAKYDRICDEVTDFSTGLRRNTAKRAAYLYARSGDVDRAVACLEVGLCKLDPELFVTDQPYGWIRSEYPGWVNHDDLRRLAPRDFSEWPEPAEWFRRAAAAVDGWIDEERVNRDRCLEFLAILALRLHEAGDGAAARDIVEGLHAREGLPHSKLLWVADVARQIELAPLADEIERTLLSERRLHVERVAEVLERARTDAGPAAALELGEEAVAFTLHPNAIEVLRKAAAEPGFEEAAAHWDGVLAARASAEEKLEELDAEDEAEEEG